MVAFEARVCTRVTEMGGERSDKEGKQGGAYTRYRAGCVASRRVGTRQAIGDARQPVCKKCLTANAQSVADISSIEIAPPAYEYQSQK